MAKSRQTTVAHTLEVAFRRLSQVSLLAPSDWNALQKPWVMWNHRAMKPMNAMMISAVPDDGITRVFMPMAL